MPHTANFPHPDFGLTECFKDNGKPVPRHWESFYKNRRSIFDPCGPCGATWYSISHLRALMGKFPGPEEASAIV